MGIEFSKDIKHPAYDHSKLYGPISGFNNIQKETQKLVEIRNCNRQSRVIIINRTQYDLKIKQFNSSSGYFFVDPRKAFQGPGETIKPDYMGAFTHTKAADTTTGSVGYLSFNVATSGRNYVVCCGFSTPYSSKNCAGVQIRGADGVTDDKGRINGHGVDATGTVTDVDELCSVPFAETGEKFHTFYESVTPFMVKCYFKRADWGLFIYEVTPTGYISKL